MFVGYIFILCYQTRSAKIVSKFVNCKIYVSLRYFVKINADLLILPHCASKSNTLDFWS